MTEKKEQPMFSGSLFGGASLFNTNKDNSAGNVASNSNNPFLVGANKDTNAVFGQALLFGNNSPPKVETQPTTHKAPEAKPSLFEGSGSSGLNFSSSSKTVSEKVKPASSNPLFPFNIGGQGIGSSFGKKTEEEKEPAKSFPANFERKEALTSKEEQKDSKRILEEPKKFDTHSNKSIMKLLTSNLDLIEMTKEGVISKPLIGHNEEDYELVKEFHKQFIKLQNELKMWAGSESLKEKNYGPELILAGCDEYFKILYNVANKTKSPSLRKALNEMSMMMLALVVIHMRPKETINSEKLSKLAQCHAQSNELWDEYEKLKKNHKSGVHLAKDDYKNKIVEGGEKYLIEGICTGNYIECQKALELGKVFPKNNGRLVQLENLIKNLHGRNVSLQTKEFYKRMNENEYEESFIFNRDKAKQILRGFHEVPEKDKKLQETLETALLILSGDEKTIQDKCTTCIQHIFCYFAYQKANPNLKQIEILCDTVKGKYKVKKESLEYKVLEIMSANNPFDVLTLFCGNHPPWFPIHCMDVYNLFLKVNGRLTEYMDEEDFPVQQFAVLFSLKSRNKKKNYSKNTLNTYSH